jgi:hypothetical protein
VKTLTIMKTHTQVYSLLAVKSNQLSPNRVELKVAEDGFFFVKNAHLLANTQSLAQDKWIKNMYEGVLEDIDFVAKSPLYNNTCAQGIGCPRRHWSCPYVLSRLFSGSSAPLTNNSRKVFLITPGKLLQPCCQHRMVYISSHFMLFQVVFGFSILA